MKYRPFGRTGINVRPYCLGAMMFGAGGNPDHEECTRIVHQAVAPAPTSSTRPTRIAAASPKKSSAEP